MYISECHSEYIKCSSSGRLSKYYTHGEDSANKYPLKVVRESSIIRGQILVQDIHEATDLFEKFSNSHSVARIHCEFESLLEKDKTAILKIVQS